MTKAADKNTQKYATAARDAVRRSDFEKTDEDWIRELVTIGEVANIATIHENQPFITPISYVYVQDAHAIYFHGAQVGRMRANAELNPNAAVNIMETMRMLPYPDAADLSVEYKSVTLFGKIQKVTDAEEELMGLHALIGKYFPHLTIGVDLNPIPDHELKRVGVFKIEIESWTGKQLQEPPEHPGAFVYPNFPAKK